MASFKITKLKIVSTIIIALVLAFLGSYLVLHSLGGPDMYTNIIADSLRFLQLGLLLLFVAIGGESWAGYGLVIFPVVLFLTLIPPVYVFLSIFTKENS